MISDGNLVECGHVLSLLRGRVTMSRYKVTKGHHGMVISVRFSVHACPRKPRKYLTNRNFMPMPVRPCFHMDIGHELDTKVSSPCIRTRLVSNHKVTGLKWRAR